MWTSLLTQSLQCRRQPHMKPKPRPTRNNHMLGPPTRTKQVLVFDEPPVTPRLQANTIF
jgi:hypothetical protein